MGKLVRIITSDGAVLASAMDSTTMVSRAEQIHKSSATVTAAIGRLITAASLMGSMIKDDDTSVTLKVSGGGPAGTIIAVADACANAKVTVTNPVIELPLNQMGKLDVAGAVGVDGLLSVIKDYGRGSPQTGHCQLVTGEIGEDITNYFATSEQIPTVCSLGVLVNPNLTVKAAGGMLIQLLPGASDQTIDMIEANLAELEPVSTMIRNGLTPMEILHKALKGFELEVLNELSPEYVCDCSDDRVERALLSLGRDELEKLAQEQEEIKVECHFCEHIYRYTPDKIKKMIKTI